MRDYYNQKSIKPGCFYTGPDDHAGEALETIAEKIPDFFQTLIDARTSIAGLRKMARQIDSLERSLYMRLSKLEYEDSFDFVNGAEMIQKALAVRALNEKSA